MHLGNSNQKYFLWVDDLFDAIEEDQDVRKIIQLVEAGADINVKVEEGCTPLIAAVFIGNLEIVKLLVKLGANVNALDENSESALFYAKFNKFQDIADYLEHLTSPEVRHQVDREIKYLKRTSKHFEE